MHLFIGKVHVRQSCSNILEQDLRHSKYLAGIETLVGSLALRKGWGGGRGEEGRREEKGR